MVNSCPIYNNHEPKLTNQIVEYKSLCTTNVFLNTKGNPMKDNSSKKNQEVMVIVSFL